ncbi:hypothetical protein F5Y15DRAFT_292654 [Xylariaceae sp. FL0016]|nr:hypothetical protein F5Y15DRAFT_292654 [Xylariaceae sp. FL0016]
MRQESVATSGDGRPQSSHASSPEASDSKPGNRSKANIRVSLACTQCRGKHVKCDATLPACNRCRLEGKTCFYAKSRRGIRDAKKRSLISDKPPVSPSRSFPISKSPVAHTSSQLPYHLPEGWTSMKRLESPTGVPESSLDLFFNYFHPAHPCLPPRKFFLNLVDAEPEPHRFLLSVIDFCGSLYTRHVYSEEYRESAYSTACAPLLPFTTQSVQGLLLLGIVAFGELNFDHHAGLVNRAIGMALELGMQHKSFSDRTLSPILAESFRRTWWLLMFQDAFRMENLATPSHSIAGMECDVDLPCEEWEYESGIIPRPMSQSQYEAKMNHGSGDCSSMAYAIEAYKVKIGDIYLSNEAPDGNDETFERADARICSLLRRVPRWKMDLVDPDGKCDMVLFHAMAWAHINRLRLRQSAPRQGINLREYFHMGPACGPDRDGQKAKNFGWNPHPFDIQAANGVCDLFRYPFPTQNMCPNLGPALVRVALVYLDACVFRGLDSPAFREKIQLLIQILTEHGKIWPLSKRVAEEIKAVEKEYLPRPDQKRRTGPMGHLGQINQTWRAGSSDTVDTWTSSANMLSDGTILSQNSGLGDLYQDFNIIQGWTSGDSWPGMVNIYPA